MNEKTETIVSVLDTLAGISILLVLCIGLYQFEEWDRMQGLKRQIAKSSLVRKHFKNDDELRIVYVGEEYTPSIMALLSGSFAGPQLTPSLFAVYGSEHYEMFVVPWGYLEDGRVVKGEVRLSERGVDDSG